MKELERYKKAIEKVKVFVRNSCTTGFADHLERELDAILSPPPEMEEVEVVRWECKTCGAMFKSQEVSSGNTCCWGADTLVKLTGTLKRPKPQPVERTVSGEVEWDRACDGSVYPTGKDVDFHWPELFGKSGTLTFTWTDDPK